MVNTDVPLLVAERLGDLLPWHGMAWHAQLLHQRAIFRATQNYAGIMCLTLATFAERVTSVHDVELCVTSLQERGSRLLMLLWL